MKALVTGGGGFLGGEVVRQLLARGDQVRNFARGDYPELSRLGVELIQGDLTDPQAVASAVKGCDVVFHVAAKAGIGGHYQSYYRVNVLGTRHILEACRRAGVHRLVYTSSPSVVFNGDDMECVDESAPYPRHYEAHYPRTKAIAERAVLAANGAELATVALRPHLIWGPGDNHLIPRILARARAGRLRRIGQTNKKIDATYIYNAAHAHLLAADRLEPGSPVAGKVYFVSQGEPVPVWDLINRILQTADLPPVTRSVPAGLAYVLSWGVELAYSIMCPEAEPPLARFVTRELATAHWFNLAAARRDLNYHLLVSTEQGMVQLAMHMRTGIRPSDEIPR